MAWMAGEESHPEEGNCDTQSLNWNWNWKKRSEKEEKSEWWRNYIKPFHETESLLYYNYKLRNLIEEWKCVEKVKVREKTCLN